MIFWSNPDIVNTWILKNQFGEVSSEIMNLNRHSLEIQLVDNKIKINIYVLCKPVRNCPETIGRHKTEQKCNYTDEMPKSPSIKVAHRSPKCKGIPLISSFIRMTQTEQQVGGQSRGEYFMKRFTTFPWWFFMNVSPNLCSIQIKSL